MSHSSSHDIKDKWNRSWDLSDSWAMIPSPSKQVESQSKDTSLLFDKETNRYPTAFHRHHTPMDDSMSAEMLSDSSPSKEISIKLQPVISIDKSSDDTNPLPADAARGLLSPRAFFFLMMWYLFSAFTLFLNKYILTSLGGDPVMLSTMQMVMTTSGGFVQIFFPCGMYKQVKREFVKPPKFFRNMTLIGSLRFLTVFLGLIALKYVPVSFTETVKSSAPIFTVLIACLMTGERTGLFTQLSLIPIMSGLALCSAYELSFNIQGFMAALGTNLSECMQNVYSKMLICGEKFKYTPAEMQFYTSIASIAVQIPTALILMDIPHVYATTDSHLLLMYFVNGLCFHYQTISAYVLMGYISPVTHSVANTVKRAFLIWSSVLIFGNTVTFLSGLGTVIVTVGVFLYNKAGQIDQARRDLSVHYSAKKLTTI